MININENNVEQTITNNENQSNILDFKMSVYIILYSDLGFLNDIIENISNLVDEIIIVDGPYIYNIDVLKKLGLFYDVSSIPEELIKLLVRYSNKIKYNYDTYTCQEDKRKAGYDACSNEIIMSLDCDEFANINIDNVKKFVSSQQRVARCSIYNMNRINVNMDSKVTKNILFKKSLISSNDHLAYTWSCASEDNKPVTDFIYTENEIGEIYHQTLNRNKSDSIIKYIYYITLYYHLSNNKELVDISNLHLIGDFSINDLIDDLSVEQIIDIFYHSKLELIGIPSSDKVLTLNNNVSVNLDKYKNNHIQAIFSENTIAIRNIPYYCILPIEKISLSEIEILFDNVTQIQISIYEINYNEPFKIFQKTYTIDTDTLLIKYWFKKKMNYFSTIIMFNCIHTIDNTKKYGIKKVNKYKVI